MQDKYLKDFVIGLIVIMIIAFMFNDYRLFTKARAIPEQSKYSNIALDENLLSKIQSIETTINDRKMFTFTVTKDPLQQDLIVKTKVDLQNQWEDMVRSMMRLSATFTDSKGQKKAMIAFQGRDNLVGIGDVVGGRKIVDIQNQRVYFTENGYKGFLDIQKIPPKPVELDTQKQENQYNW